MALKAEDDEDPFWVAAFEGRELDARDELMPDREHEEIGEAALTLSHRSRSKGQNGHTIGSKSEDDLDGDVDIAKSQVFSRWTPAEVKVCTVDIPLLPRTGYFTTTNEEAGSSPHSAATSSPPQLKVCVREVLSDGVLSVTGGELWPAARILAQLLAGASVEPSKNSSLGEPHQKNGQQRQGGTAAYAATPSVDGMVGGAATTPGLGCETANSSADEFLRSSKESEGCKETWASVRSARVLELGAGLGLVGLAAARLGAMEVALSEVVPSLLSNLDATVALNEVRFGAFPSSFTRVASTRTTRDRASNATNDQCAPSETPACNGSTNNAVAYALPLNWCDWQPSEGNLDCHRAEVLEVDNIHDSEKPEDKTTADCLRRIACDVPNVPRALDGGCFDVIVGSELVYAPHHRYLADLIFDLLRAHRREHPLKMSPSDGRQACCVIVQRADRPGWAHFLARAKTIGLAVHEVPVQMIADAVAAEGTAANSRRAQSSMERDSKKNGKQSAAASGSSAKSEMAVESSPGMCEVNTAPTVNSAATVPPIELGPSGIDLSPYVLCELTLPTSLVLPRVHAREQAPPLSPSMAQGMRKGAYAADHSKAAASEDSRADDLGTTWPAVWPALVDAYLRNTGRDHRGSKNNA